MDPGPRAAFNRAWSPALYRHYVERVQSMLGEVPFRLAETPFFVSPALRDSLDRSATEIVDQLSRPALLTELQKAIPDRYRAPGMDPLPSCLQVDFAITPAPGGGLEGKVVELQAFPSGYAMMLAFARAWSDVLQSVPEMEGPWSCCVVPDARAIRLLGDTILGGEDPESVVLVDFEPQQQKTRPDFVATRQLFGVDAVCPTELVKEGRRLIRQTADGRRVQVRRIYNRMVFDELEKKSYQLPFAWSDDLDLTWCSHPNWYWPWSKASLPYLEHPAVPRARFLSEIDTLPDDLSGYVLKPLFSFAGSGVVIDVRPLDVEHIPRHQRGGWVLQEKISYAPAIRTPEGIEVKAEVRVMLVRPPAAPTLVPIIHLVRLSRGKMLGVDQNKGLDWVGASVGLWRPIPG
jgi:hypothetical protein